MRPHLPLKQLAAPTLKPMRNAPKARTLPGIAPRNVGPAPARRESPLAGPKLDGR
jgi:hypothetical protein